MRGSVSRVWRRKWSGSKRYSGADNFANDVADNFTDRFTHCIRHGVAHNFAVANEFPEHRDQRIAGADSDTYIDERRRSSVVEPHSDRDRYFTEFGGRLEQPNSTPA